MPGVTDRYARPLQDLRISLTDRCNFRCSYCLPNGFVKQKGLPEELAPDELRRAVQAFASLGLCTTCPRRGMLFRLKRDFAMAEPSSFRPPKDLAR